LSPRSDDRGVTHRRKLDDRTADALLSGRDVDGETELSSLIAEMRAPTAAPVPNAALSALLASGFTPGVAPLPVKRVRRTWALPLQVALGTSACLALVLGAAAAGDLPDSAQTAVADVVEAVTPLHVPRPDSHPVPAVVPSPTRSAKPSPTPSDDSHQGSSPRPSASPDGNRGRGSSDGGSGGDSTAGGRPHSTPSANERDGSSSGGSGDSGSSGSGSHGSRDSGSGGSRDSGSGGSGSTGSGSTGSGSSGSGSGGSESGGSGSSGSGTDPIGDRGKDLSRGHDGSVGATSQHGS
jgi:hypothetical protein